MARGYDDIGYGVGWQYQQSKYTPMCTACILTRPKRRAGCRLAQHLKQAFACKRQNPPCIITGVKVIAPFEGLLKFTLTVMDWPGASVTGGVLM